MISLILPGSTPSARILLKRSWSLDLIPGSISTRDLAVYKNGVAVVFARIVPEIYIKLVSNFHDSPTFARSLYK